MEGLNSRKQGERVGKGQDQANGALGDFEDLTAWKRKFIELGGVRHLLDTLVGLQIEAIDSRLTLRCIESLLAALLDFMRVDQALYGEILQKKEPVVLTCMRYLHLIGLYGLQVERSRGEAVEDIQAKRTQKRLAKQKMRQLQMASLGSQGRRRGAADNDKDSDGDEDESAEQLNHLVQEFGEVCSLVAQLFSFMDRFVFEQDKGAIRILEQYPNLQEMVTVLVLQSENHLVRREAGGRVRAMLARCSGEPALQPTMTALLKVLLTKVLPEAHNQERRCGEYFEQLQLALEELKASDLAPLEEDLWQLAQSLTADIEARETREVDAKVEDRVLVGMMTVLRVLLQKFPARKAAVGARLVPHLLHECLFEVPQGSGAGANGTSKPKCKSMASRTGALRLLSVLSRDCLENLGLVLDYIRDFGRRASWRTNKSSDWEITHLDDEKSSTGYVGLKNLGCICYMISLMQQLFMVPSFRADLLAIDDPNHDGLEPDENMFYQLQAIFSGLLKSEKQYVNPKGFCHAFKDWDGQPTNVLEQMDVDEFLQMFLDRLEGAIKGSAHEKTVQSHFGGTFASEMICKGCPHQYVRSEPFVSLCVPVKNKRSIQEGLSAFVQGDMLEGDNAYLCAKCDKKVDTLKRTCVKELPRYLIITLKRFEFDFDRMVRVKVNDYWEFPLDLDMLPYTQEGLARREKAAKKKQEAAERGEDEPEEADDEPLKHPRDYYEFKLKGIVVHTGTADSGHYYSFIREHKEQGDERWYEFNDHTVSDFDINELDNECFGGEDGFTGQGMMQMRSQKWRNAYLVIYERKNQQEIHDEEAEAVVTGIRPAASTTVADQVESMMDEESKSTAAKAVKLSSPEHPIQQKIQLENQKYWQNKFLFGNEYFEFVSEVTHYWDTAHITPLSVVNKNSDAHIVGFQQRAGADRSALQAAIPRPLDELSDLRAQHADSPQSVADASHEVFKFAASFYLTILQRAAHKALVPKMLDALKAYLNHDQRNGEWLIRELSNWEIVKEMLLQPQGQEMPKLTCGLIYSAMLTIYDKEKASLANFWPDAEKQRRANPGKTAAAASVGTLGNFILLLLSHLYDLKAFVHNLPHYFQILARFASLGPEARAMMLRARIVGRCMDFFFDAASPYRGLFGDVSDLGPVITREEPELGLPTMMDKKVRTYFQMIQEKRRKQLLAGATPKYKYLMELVGTCVRHLRVGGPGGAASPYQLDGDFEGALTAFAATQEADIFIPEARFLKRFIVEAKRNRSAWAVARAHCHYAYQDREQVEELFRTVEAGLNEHDYDGIRPFLCLFELLLETAGEHFTSRRAVWLARFLETVKGNFGFFKWMEAILEFIFKITSRNTAVREWFYSNPGAWHCLLEWVGQHTRAPHPAQGASSGVRLFKGRQNIQLAALQHHNDPNAAARNSIGAAYRLGRMQELLRQQVPDLSEEPDPDKIDLQDFKFVPGDVVTRLDRKRDEAGQWRVLSVLDEMIQMECLEPDRANKGVSKDPTWQKCDTDKLLLFDTYRQLTRTRLWRELHEQGQAQRAEAARGAAGLGRADADEDMEDGARGGRTHHRVGQATGGTTNDASSHAQQEANSSEYDSSDDEHADGAN